MFDIGFLELVLIAIVGLLVMGPERLPGAIRTGSLWLARLKASFQHIKADFEREIGADEIKQQIHNEALLKSLANSKAELEEASIKLRQEADKLQYDIDDIVDPQSIDPKNNDAEQ
jgi:sec-independent protein translocase protein TatB